jgi:hypothetical protein
MAARSKGDVEERDEECRTADGDVPCDADVSYGTGKSFRGAATPSIP